ncbi:MAG: hypothetical protein HY606_06070, partial [Planctomycetes bacterium]|nr:hypothetical protein [Planctomycetota bacterium]
MQRFWGYKLISDEKLKRIRSLYDEYKKLEGKPNPSTNDIGERNRHKDTLEEELEREEVYFINDGNTDNITTPSSEMFLTWLDDIDFSRQILSEDIPWDHIFRDLMRIPISTYVDAEEKDILDILEKTGMITHDERNGIHSLEDEKVKKKYILKYLTPLIINSGGMPKNVRIQFMLVVSSYFFHYHNIGPPIRYEYAEKSPKKFHAEMSRFLQRLHIGHGGHRYTYTLTRTDKLRFFFKNEIGRILWRTKLYRNNFTRVLSLANNYLNIHGRKKSQRTNSRKRIMIAVIAAIMIAVVSPFLVNAGKSLYQILSPPEGRIVLYLETHSPQSSDQFVQKMEEMSKHYPEIYVVLEGAVSVGSVRTYFGYMGWPFPTRETLEDPFTLARLRQFMEKTQWPLGDYLLKSARAGRFQELPITKDHGSTYRYLGEHPNIRVIQEQVPVESVVFLIRSEFAYQEALEALYSEKNEDLFFQKINDYLSDFISSAELRTGALAGRIRPVRKDHPHAGILARLGSGRGNIQNMFDEDPDSKTFITTGLNPKIKEPVVFLQEKYGVTQIINGQVPRSDRNILLTIFPHDLVLSYFKGDLNAKEALNGLFEKMRNDPNKPLDQLTREIQENAALLKNQPTGYLGTFILLWLKEHGYLTPDIRQYLIPEIGENLDKYPPLQKLIQELKSQIQPNPNFPSDSGTSNRAAKRDVSDPTHSDNPPAQTSASPKETQEKIEKEPSSISKSPEERNPVISFVIWLNDHSKQITTALSLTYLSNLMQGSYWP